MEIWQNSWGGGIVLILSLITLVTDTLAVAAIIVGGTALYRWTIHFVYGRPSMKFDRPSKPSPSPLERSIHEIVDYMHKSRKEIYWSDVYYAMRQRQIVGSMSAQRFGYFIQNNGGPSESVVRRSGDYNLSGIELSRRADIIDHISTFL